MAVVDAAESVIVESEHGVVVELRRWARDKTKWLDYYACEWCLQADGSWQSRGFNSTRATEIGRWSGSSSLHEAVKRAGSNKSGFQNWTTSCGR